MKIEWELDMLRTRSHIDLVVEILVQARSMMAYLLFRSTSMSWVRLRRIHLHCQTLLHVYLQDTTFFLIIDLAASLLVAHVSPGAKLSSAICKQSILVFTTLISSASLRSRSCCC